MTTYTRKIDALTVCHLTKKEAATRNMCKPYQWLIQQHGTPTNAFVYKHAFRMWLQERGLKLEGRAARYQKIIGTFYERSFIDSPLPAGEESLQLDNGDYTRAVITKGEDGLKVVNYHNANTRNREVADYRWADAIFN